jgi:hypothetical protein
MIDRILRPWFDFTAIALLIIMVEPREPSLTDRFLLTQDLPVLCGVLIVALLFRVIPGLGWVVEWLGRNLGRGPLAAFRLTGGVTGLASLGLALLAIAVACVGASVAYEGYALSLDEYMANFDAAIIAKGQLMAPTSPVWRGYLTALQPIFVNPIGGGADWASVYLPVNAAMRGLASRVGAEALVSPLLAAIAVIAVHGVARRLWPERPGLALIAAVLLATSSQFLVTAMTSYAMTAHLAFNMVWLWLFMRGGKLGHAGALLTGFLACGLHQLVFHPLFAAPFVLQLYLERRWRLAAVYTLAYGLICGFWVEYWPIVTHLTPMAATAAPVVGGGASSGYFQAEVKALLKDFDPGDITLMAENLIRFATWQNPLTAPLAVLAAYGAIKTKGVLRSLVLGGVLTIVVVYAVQAYQGHGWGYRYVHGLLGSACLLAAWTWGRLTAGETVARRGATRVGFAAVAAISLFGLFPLRAWQVHRFVHPFASAEAAIRRAPTQVVIVDETRVWYGVDLVRNDPFLANRPLVFSLADLGEDQVRALCAAHTVALFDARSARAFHIRRDPDPPDTDVTDLRDLMSQLHCGDLRITPGLLAAAPPARPVG